MSRETPRIVLKKLTPTRIVTMNVPISVRTLAFFKVMEEV